MDDKQMVAVRRRCDLMNGTTDLPEIRLKGVASVHLNPYRPARRYELYSCFFLSRQRKPVDDACGVRMDTHAS